MADISITAKPSFRNVLGQFTEANDELLDDKRDMMRRLGQKWVKFMRDEAPKGKTGKFAKSIRFTTKKSGDTITLDGTMPQPLGTFITEGTKPHIIAARNAGALRFFWPKVGMITIVPKGGGFKTHVRNGTLLVGKGFVNHPGTKPNPFNARAFAKWKPQATIELNRITVNWRRNATS